MALAARAIADLLDHLALPAETEVTAAMVNLVNRENVVTLLHLHQMF